VAYQTFSISGNGVHDLGSALVVTDIEVELNTLGSIVPYDFSTPNAVHRAGYIAVGDVTNADGSTNNIFYWHQRWIDFARWLIADFQANEVPFRYVRWHLNTGVTGHMRVSY